MKAILVREFGGPEVCQIVKKELEINPYTEVTLDRVIEKYPDEIDYLKSFPNWSDGYYFGLFVSMEFCINLITNGEELTRKNNSRVGFSSL